MLTTFRHDCDICLMHHYRHIDNIPHDCIGPRKLSRSRVRLEGTGLGQRFSSKNTSELRDVGGPGSMGHQRRVVCAGACALTKANAAAA